MSMKNGKLSPEDFVLKLIPKLTPEGKKGFIPTLKLEVLNDLTFNRFFELSYHGLKAKEFTRKMAEDRKIVILPMRSKKGYPFVLLCPPGTETHEERRARLEKTTNGTDCAKRADDARRMLGL